MKTCLLTQQCEDLSVKTCLCGHSDGDRPEQDQQSDACGNFSVHRPCVLSLAAFKAVHNGI